MTTPLATDPRGNKLSQLTAASIDELAEAAKHTPCPLSLVALVDESTGGVLFGKNRWRHEYELPGGIIEEGESYYEAARRELEEESGLRVDNLELIGFARFSLVNPARDELGAIYFARVTDHTPQDSAELEAFIWRSPLSTTTIAISPLDDTIASWAIRAR